MMTKAWSNCSFHLSPTKRQRTQVVRRVESTSHDSPPLPMIHFLFRKAPFLKTPQAPQMAPLTRVQIRDPFTQKPQPRLLLSAGTDGAEALLLVDFPISETHTSRSTGWGVWVWKMTKIGAWRERGLYLITVKWFDNCREHWKIPGYTLIFGMFSSTQTPHTPSKEVL